MKSEKAEQVVESLYAERPEGAGHFLIELVDKHTNETIEDFISSEPSSGGEFSQHFVAVVKYRVSTGTTRLPDGDVVDEYPVPDWLQGVAQSFESVTLSTGYLEVSDTRSETVFMLDDLERETVDNADAKKIKAIIDKAKAQLPVPRSIRRKIAAEFDSFEAIVLADEDELRSVNGVGETRASQIYNRYSDRVREYVASEEYSKDTTLPLIEDQYGVLRLPEEFDSGLFSPETASL